MNYAPMPIVSALNNSFLWNAPKIKTNLHQNEQADLFSQYNSWTSLLLQLPHPMQSQTTLIQKHRQLHHVVHSVKSWAHPYLELLLLQNLVNIRFHWKSHEKNKQNVQLWCAIWKEKTSTHVLTKSTTINKRWLSYSLK